MSQVGDSSFLTQTNDGNGPTTEAQQMLDSFWQRVTDEIKGLEPVCVF